MTGGRVSGEQGAAKVLGLKPTTLEARMKKRGIAQGLTPALAPVQAPRGGVVRGPEMRGGALAAA